MAARTRRRLAVDLDGWLWDFYAHILAWRFDIPLEDATYIVRHSWRSPMLENNWGGTGLEAGELVKQFYEQFDFLNCKPIPGMAKLMARLAKRYDLYLTTSNEHLGNEVLLAWLDIWFPGIFVAKIIRTNQWDSKTDAMRENKLALLLEDRDDYGRKVAADGLLAVVMERYLWSRGLSNSRLMHVPESADAVCAAVTSMLALAA